MSSDFEYFERQELIQKLIKNGFGDLVNKFLENENKCFTKKYRLNKSGACRILGLKTKELETLLNGCKTVLESDLGD